jgi:hypothetical protein
MPQQAAILVLYRSELQFTTLIKLTRLVLARLGKLDKHPHIQVLDKPGRPGMCWRYSLLSVASRRVARLLGPVDSGCPALVLVDAEGRKNTTAIYLSHMGLY